MAWEQWGGFCGKGPWEPSFAKCCWVLMRNEPLPTDGGEHNMLQIERAILKSKRKKL